MKLVKVTTNSKGMQVLSTIGKKDFCLSKEFHPSFLIPVGEYVNWKLKHAWDDYNELFHAVNFFEKVKKEKEVSVDCHLMQEGEKLLGVVFIVTGSLEIVEKKYNISNPEKAVLLKYFHIMEEGRGNGKKWLTEIILPYYKEKGFESVYVSSSHEKSFSLYKNYGRLIHEYTAKSDNGLFNRYGKCFEITIN